MSLGIALDVKLAWQPCLVVTRQLNFKALEQNVFVEVVFQSRCQMVRGGIVCVVGRKVCWGSVAAIRSQAVVLVDLHHPV